MSILGSIQPVRRGNPHPIPTKGNENSGPKPVKLKVSTYLQKHLEEPYDVYAAESPTMAEEIARRWTQRALQDQKAATALLDRTEGAVTQRVEVLNVHMVEAASQLIYAYVPEDKWAEATKFFTEAVASSI